MNKKIILSLIICSIIGGTSFLFHYTQRAYMYEQYGRSASLMRHYDAAQDYFLKALKVAPEKPSDILQLLLKNGRFISPPSGAQKAFELLESKGDRDRKILNSLADYFFEFKRLDLAEKVYVYWSRFDHSLSLRRKLAKVLVWQKKYPEAVEFLEKLRADFPNDIGLLRLWIDANSWNKNYPVAIDGYEQLKKRIALSKEDLLQYAEVLRFNGQNEKAAEVYQQVIGGK
jgi:tetratricopeptide (TPR) repeat protein